MPSTRTGRRPNRSESGPMMNWPTPKPIRNADSTSCGRLAIVTWNVAAMFGSAGNIMSIASGFRAMIEAITRTNSRNPIGRWLDETPSALISVTAYLTGNAIVSVMLRFSTHLPGWLLRDLRLGLGNNTKGQSDALVNKPGEERRGY